MMEERIVEKNRQYWDDHADLWFGATEETMSDTEDNSPKAQKARMIPLSMCFKCRKIRDSLDS